MTYAELIKLLTKEQVDQWWDSPRALALSNSESQWKYKIKRNDRSIPYKEGIRDLAEFHNIELEDFTSNDHNRDKFCETFDFEIVELLVYDSTEENNFLSYYQNRVSNEYLLKKFLSHCGGLLNEIGIDPYHFRFAITADHKIRGIIGMRVVLGYNERSDNSYITFYLTKEQFQRIVNILPSHEIHEYKGDDAIAVSLNVKTWEEIPEDLLELSKQEIASYYSSVRSTKMNRWNSEAKSTNSLLKKLVFENIDIDEWIKNSENQNDMRQLDLDSKRIFKISMGTFLKHPDYAHVDPIAAFEENNIVVMHSETSKNQGHNFIHEPQIGDFVYLTYGQRRLGNLYKITTDIMQANKQVNVDINDGWVCRGVETVQEPIRTSTNDLHDKLTWLPSGYSTFVEITDIEAANRLLFEPYYNIHINNGILPSTMKIENATLNQILYGPPGTGKTFHTINKTVQIIDAAFFEKNKNNRKELKRRFKELQTSGQIVFSTFHQSMSYEDFIEGIKPATDTKGSIFYNTEAGIFKEISIAAAYEYYLDQKKPEQKVQPEDLDFDLIFTEYKAYLESGLKEDSLPPFVSKSGTESRLKEITKRDVLYLKPTDAKPYPVSKSRLQQLHEAFDSIGAIQNVSDDIRAVIGGCNATLFWAVFDDFKKFEAKLKEEDESQNISIDEDDELNIKEERLSNFIFPENLGQAKKYVIIIDEINRGNVSAIFGELITLLEPDKRAGRPEELGAILPYSKTYFRVPPNLFVIGTMNTADRSVEALDTALRRRFSFEEMMPNTDLLTPSACYCRLLWQYELVDWDHVEYKLKEDDLFELLKPNSDMIADRKKVWGSMKSDNNRLKLDYFEKYEFAGLNLKVILDKINERIEQLINRDHTIGHSYFIGVNSLVDLEFVFKDKIIPLLQEYFYGDYGKIGLVLGAGFVRFKAAKNDIFAKLGDYQGADELSRDRFELVDFNQEFDFERAIESLLG